MDIDPRNYDLGELRGPPTKSDTDTGGTDHTDRDDEDGGSAGDARRDVPEPVRDDERREPIGREPASRQPLPSAGMRKASTGTERTTTDRYRRLVAIERTFDGDPEKPYLTTLPTAFSDEVMIFEWLDSLLGHAGHRNTVSALRYYREIGWITEAVETSLRGYLGGFDAGASNEELTATDHLDSLLAITQLASPRRKG